MAHPRTGKLAALSIASLACIVAMAAMVHTARSAPGDDVVLVGAGDISACTNNNDEATALVLDGIVGSVFTLGDNVYDNGTTTEFANCYDPTWGRHKARTHPTSGNHEYNTAGATGYYGYFGSAAGNPSQGYYSWDANQAWHVIVLNSECTQIGGCTAGSPQESWLRADLATNASKNVIAMMHKPRFSSGTNVTTTQALWDALYEYGAEVVLAGHDHDYERFAPQNPLGVADPTYGIREFVVGTGGKSLSTFGAIKPNSQARNSTAYGVLKLTLHASSYDWEFVPIAGQIFTDSGTAAVHAAPPQATSTSTATPSATRTPTRTNTPIPTATRTATPTGVASNTPTPTSTASETPSPTSTPSNTPTPTETMTATASPTLTVAPSETETPASSVGGLVELPDVAALPATREPHANRAIYGISSIILLILSVVGAIGLRARHD